MSIIPEIVSEIDKNLISLKLPESLKFISIDKYIFPDKHIINASYNERIIVLKNNNQNIGLFQFGVRKIDNNGFTSFNINTPVTIVLDFVQGVKQKNKEFVFPKGWQEVIVNSFITACATTLEKNPNTKIRYSEFIGDSYLERKQEIEYLQKRYQDLLNYSKNSKSSKTEMNTLIKKQKLEILKAQNQLMFINAIRDRYFDKDGYLNFNKERVKQIFKTHTENKLKIKKLVAKKNIKIKINIRK